MVVLLAAGGLYNEFFQHEYVSNVTMLIQKDKNVKDSVGMLRKNGGIHFPFIAGAQPLLLFTCELCGLCEKW